MIYTPGMATHKNLPADRPIKPKPTSGGTTVKLSQTPNQPPQGGGAPGTSSK